MSVLFSGSEHTESKNEFASAVLQSLSETPKSIPCRFLYDARGSELFEEITELDEYYVTRTELSLLNSIKEDIAEKVGAGVALVEFGSGASKKTKVLIETLKNLAAYVPIEISQTAMDEANVKLKQAYPWLKITAINADFSQRIEFDTELSGIPKLGFFPGSTIGNFNRDGAVEFLKHAGETLGPQGMMLIGADLDKSEDLLIPAYNDSDGVTQEFILNIMKRVNRELGGNFDYSNFRYEAVYNRERSRVEMHIVSLRDQTVSILGSQFSFRSGEWIHIENSHKFSIESFQSIASSAGWQAMDYWVDENNLFSVHLLQNFQ